jgi:hypothetical protein
VLGVDFLGCVKETQMMKDVHFSLTYRFNKPSKNEKKAERSVQNVGTFKILLKFGATPTIKQRL